MWILDDAIENRTENWKTARHFAPLIGDGDARAALVQRLGEPDGITGDQVKLELFWKGMRDYKHQTGKTDEVLREKCARAYGKEPFHNLRGRIKAFNDENRSRIPMKDENYEVSDSGKTGGLLQNLLNTEIDIVLETPRHLYVGEAKQESRLGATGGYVLVHQLIREYVMANILLDLNGNDKKVVPFLVVDEKKHSSVMRHGQVQFMISQEWLDEKNVLTWGDIRSLQP